VVRRWKRARAGTFERLTVTDPRKPASGRANGALLLLPSRSAFPLPVAIKGRTTNDRGFGGHQTGNHLRFAVCDDDRTPRGFRAIHRMLVRARASSGAGQTNGCLFLGVQDKLSTGRLRNGA